MEPSNVVASMITWATIDKVALYVFLYVMLARPGRLFPRREQPLKED